MNLLFWLGENNNSFDTFFGHGGRSHVIWVFSLDGHFQDVFLGPAMGVILHDLESFGGRPIMDAVFLADHEGPFLGVAILVEGLFGIAILAISDVDSALALSSDTREGHFLFAVAADGGSFHMAVAHRFTVLTHGFMREPGRMIGLECFVIGTIKLT